MRITRAAIGDTVYLVRVEGDDVVLIHRETGIPGADALREALAGDITLDQDGQHIPLDEVRLLAPVRQPSKFLGVGLNYRAHAAESGMDVPERPTLFVKTTNTIVGPTDEIVYQADTSQAVDYEVELAVVIGLRGRCITPAEADSVILGYTVCNDVTARDAQFADGQWVRGKSFDTFAPLGPVIVTMDEIGNDVLRLRTLLNGEIVQDGTTADMIFGTREIVSFISRYMTLEPGDVITTGTPPGVGFSRVPPRLLQNGDVVRCEISSIGACENRVRVT